MTMEFTEEERKEAKAFGEFYVDQMENHPNTIKYYFAETIILDWFGQTIKGEKLVTAFLKKTLSTVHHHLSEGVPVKKIGFRDTHIVKIPREPRHIPLGLMSPPRLLLPKTTQTKTPKKQLLSNRVMGNQSASSSNRLLSEQGQGDGYHNAPTLPLEATHLSPPKRFKRNLQENFDLDVVEDESEVSHSIKYVVCEGAVEFRKPSLKKLQTETKWRRPCKLSVAYTATECDYTVYLIIYEGNVKCRRNLLKDFEAEEPEN